MTASRQIQFWLIGLVVLCVLLYLLRGVLLPFVAGMAVAYFLDPAADRLEKWGCSRTMATSVITALFLLVVALLIVVLAPILQNQIISLVEKAPQYAAALQDYTVRFFDVLRDRLPAGELEKLGEASRSYANELLKWFGRILGGLWSGGLALANLLSLIFITPIVSFYLLRDWDKLVAKIDSWLPLKHRDVIREQFQEIDRTLAGFVRGQALVVLILGVFYAVALSLAGLQFGLIVGLAAGLISFIPYAGFIIGGTLSVGLALLQFGAWQPVVIVAAIFLVGQVVEGNFLSPKLVGDRVGLHAVWIIFALLTGGALLGFLGVMLAVPVAAVIGVVGRFALKQYLSSPLYDTPADDPS